MLPLRYIWRKYWKFSSWFNYGLSKREVFCADSLVERRRKLLLKWERFKELNVWAEYVRLIHVQLGTPGSISVDPRVHESDCSPRGVMLLLGRERMDKRPSCSKDLEEESVWRAFTKFDLPGKVIWAEWDSSSPLGENIWRDQWSKYFTRQTYEILSATVSLF